MSRPFYTDPLAAAWMAKHHGMEFIDLENVFESVADFAQVIAEHDGPFLVHPDSLHLLEPQELDIIHRTNGYFQTVGVHIGFPKAIAQLNAGASIIQRNGKAFHWPESDEA